MQSKLTQRRRSQPPTGLRVFWACARRDAAQSEPIRLQMMRRRMARLALRQGNRRQ